MRRRLSACDPKEAERLQRRLYRNDGNPAEHSGASPRAQASMNDDAGHRQHQPSVLTGLRWGKGSGNVRKDVVHL
ncbi:hypothetical protein E4U13_006154 [Claviceps humidiphila]|uniref:Uncharacterized protein n=1 Tax=Claviceps humidiphila TaxID=1294629 RepID=A0A9P7TQR9_9HYPO|nr:hypothetical protein E4U13_006154 [Claviceps humidiphila]